MVLGFSEKIFSGNYTFGSLAQLASVLPRPPPTKSPLPPPPNRGVDSVVVVVGGQQDLGSLRVSLNPKV